MTVSSTESVGAEASTDVNTQDVNAVDSSATETNQGVGSMLDAVKAAIADPEATPASEQGSKEPASPTSPEDAKKPDEAELSDEELQKYSKGAQHRIRELNEKSKAARAEVEQFRTELDTVKPKAERLDQLTGYMQEHRITPDHLNNALGITAMINRGEYDKALPVLENLLQQVKGAMGEVLPAELKQRVDLGYMTEADAKRLHKAELARHRTEQQAQTEREQREAQQAQRDLDSLVTKVATAADAWNAEQATSDPDWNLKSALVAERMETELYRRGPQGYPRTEKDVRALLTDAKKHVEAQVGRFRPAPKPIDTQINGRSPSPRSAAAPTSMLDAVKAGLANANGG